MDINPVLVVAIGEFVFGTGYALFLEQTTLGRYLAQHATWVSVVVGIAGTVTIAIPVLGIPAVTTLAWVFGCSGVPIIAWSLYKEAHGTKRLLDDVRK